MRERQEDEREESDGKSLKSVDFCIPRDPRSAGLVREGVCAFARARGICEDDVAALVTALGEALANAIEHSRAEAPIEVHCEIRTDQILATVRDGGVGFEGDHPIGLDLELPDTDAERGRGLPIMRFLTDTFSIQSVPGGGTAVVLGRYVHFSDGRPAAAI